MKYERIMRALYNSPAFITPATHMRLRDLLDAHMSGGMVAAAGASTGSSDEEDEPISAVRTIRLHGVLMCHASGMDEFCFGAVSLQRITREIHLALADPAVKRLVLDFDSPGGEVSGTHELAMLVRRAKAVKPVFAICRSLCASAAYYIASQASAFIATESALVGSIGVYIAVFDESVRLAKAGVMVDVIKAGKYKAMGLGKPLTKEERATLETIVLQAYEAFTRTITEERPSVEESTMQGQMFTAKDALKLGLVDHVTDDMGAVLQAIEEDAFEIAA